MCIFSLARNMNFHSLLFSIFIVFYSHTHLITHFPQGKITDCYSLRLWTVCGLCRCCSASPTDPSDEWPGDTRQQDTLQKHNFRLPLRPLGWDHTVECKNSSVQEQTQRQTHEEKLKTETALRATMSQYANTVNMRVSQALGCAAFSKTRVLKKINSRTSWLCWISSLK